MFGQRRRRVRAPHRVRRVTLARAPRARVVRLAPGVSAALASPSRDAPVAFRMASPNPARNASWMSRNEPRGRASAPAFAVALLACLAIACLAALAPAAADPTADATTATAEPFPALDPARGDGDAGEAGDGGVGDGFGNGDATRRIAFGERVALDHLGPVIVNADCSVRRITNWAGLSERERRGTSARVAARNAERLERCRAAASEGTLEGWDEAGEETGTGGEGRDEEL